MVACNGVVTEPEALHGAEPEVLDHHVGGAQERARSANSRRALEIEHHAFLVAIDRAKGRAVLEATPAAERIAAIGRLDLDHFGAEIAQQHSGVGSGYVVGELDDADSCKSPSHHIPLRFMRVSLCPVPRACRTRGVLTTRNVGTSKKARARLQQIDLDFLLIAM